MRRPVVLVACLVLMVALIVAVDFTILRDHFWGRLVVNIAIVLVAGALYARFGRRE